MSNSESTTAQGNSFRDSIKELIELTPGCTEVQTEFLVGSQPVDIYYEERTSFSSIRVACECKDYGRPLTKDLIASNIYPRYAPLLERDLVDAVRIIAPLALNATARAYVKECGFTFQTADEVASQVIDFRPYLRALKGGFAVDGLDKYFIKPVLADGSDLETNILEWISGAASRPIAILAGYGMGKTSFARRLAFLLAADALQEAQHRIPILVPLSEISGEQDLEGLLGKLFGARYPLQGYNFPAFMELNTRGRFVIILDGFDEMKHSISPAEFEHNFLQLNRLNGAFTRVLLLGRPSAFMSDAEALFVLRGKRRRGSQLFSIEGAPEYRQLELQEFSSTQALSFIRNYAAYRSSLDSALRDNDSKCVDIDDRLDSIRADPEMMSLILRPVQAKMLADLAIDPEVHWRSFTRYELFREFIQRIVSREASKPTRAAVHADARLIFLRRLAWWVWTKARSSGFRAADLPDYLVSDIPGRDPDGDPQDLKRELITGSFLESKVGDSYYFPHRSFLEFLVADFCCLEGSSKGGAAIEDIASAMTPDVREFIKDSDHASMVCRWRDGINDVEASLSIDFLLLIAWALNTAQPGYAPLVRSDATPRDLLIDYCLLVDRSVSRTEIVNYLTRVFRIAHSQTKLMVLICLLALLEKSDIEVQHAMHCNIAALILAESLDEMKRIIDQSGKYPIGVDKRNRFANLLVASFTAAHPQDSGLTLSIEGGALYDTLYAALSPKWRVAGFPMSVDDVFSDINLLELPSVDGQLALSKRGSLVSSFFRRFPNPSSLVPIVDKRGIPRKHERVV
jgi:hypothetical protein